jgi:hypothetical protein
MDPIKARHLRQFEGHTFTVAQINNLPLMPDRSVNNLGQAVDDDFQTFQTVGPFRRKLDQYDAQINPCIPDTKCEYAIVTFTEGLLIILPIKATLMDG